MRVFRITSRGVKLDLALTKRDCRSNSKKRGGVRARPERTSHTLNWTNNVLQTWITSNTGETLDYVKTQSFTFGSHLKPL